MAESFKPFDAADYLASEEDIDRYFEQVEKTGDPRLILAALGDIARARNMSQLARQAGLTRPGLYKALSAEGNPSFDTLSRVAEALGLRISIRSR
jgi:probable addiction module antidote protein